MTEVTVEVEAEEQASDAPPVVVIDSGADDGDTRLLMELTERVVRTEARLDDIESAVFRAADTAAAALDTASTAIDVAVEADATADTALELANEVAEIAIVTAEETGVVDIVAEETAGDVIPDVTPRKPHWLFRSKEDWRQEIGNS